MISSGEVFLLNGETGGELWPQEQFLNRSIRVIAAGLDRAYIACEPPVPEECEEGQSCKVWCYRGDSHEPVGCPEFEAVNGRIRQIAIGDKHLLVLTYEGVVYSCGVADYGCPGHGGAKNVPAFQPVPALYGKKVRLVAAGPMYSVAVTHDGDVFSWGQAFQGETGLFSSVESVPRFAPAVTPFRVLEVSCGHGHVLARTHGEQCITWGENTCGQLGLGRKSKPTYKPQLLDSIDSHVLQVFAAWAHSLAVGTDGKVYSWGLNSHGQLGLGDNTTRFAPELLEDLVGAHKVESVHAAKTFTVFRTASKRALLCGQVPCGPNSQVKPEFFPRRPGEKDPNGCLLTPVPLVLTASTPCGVSKSWLSQIATFDKGAIAFATSTVYKVEPSLAPSRGSTVVQAFVTGLPFENPARLVKSDQAPAKLVQDTIQVKVRLYSAVPELDVVVPGQIVDADTVEFLMPDVSASTLGSVVEKGTTAAVQLRISIDGGLTWTPDRHCAPTAADLDRTTKLMESTGKIRKESISRGLREFRAEFEANRITQEVADIGSMVLWIAKYPSEGIVHVEPDSSPVSGGTEILLHVELPTRMPTEMLTIKFLCAPLHSLGNESLEALAPLRKDTKEIINPCMDELAKLPLAPPLEVPACAWLDPGGRGVRCVTPPLGAENVQFYTYHVELSLDGKLYLPRTLPFTVFDLRITGLEPNVGPLDASTVVKIKSEGFAKTNIQRVRLDFPKDLGWPSRLLPASFNQNTGEVSFEVPDLVAEVRQRTDEERSTKESLTAVSAELETAADGDPADPVDDAEVAGVIVSPDGGLAGLEVFVELSLNGQNFTQDRMHFTYYGQVVPGILEVLALPEGVQADPVAQDPKTKKGKGAAEDSTELLAVPGAKLGVELRAGVCDTGFAALQAELVTKTGEEEPQFFKVMDLPGTIESLPLVPAGTPTPASPDKVSADDTQLRDVITALAPGIRAEDLPEGATLFMTQFKVSLNGQAFIACPECPLIKLETLQKEISQES